jgi:thiol:disulfide interchange protein DsbD
LFPSRGAPSCDAPPLALVFSFALTGSAAAQFDDPPGGDKGKIPKDFTARAGVKVEVVPVKAKRGETVLVRVTVAPKPEAHSWTYPAFPKDPSQKSKNVIVPPDPGELIFIGKVTDPPVKWEEKPREGEPGSDQVSYAPVTWELKAVVSPKATPGPKAVTLEDVSLQVCVVGNCYFADGRKLPPAEFTVEDGASDKIDPADYAEATKGAAPVAPKAEGPGPVRNDGPKAPAGTATGSASPRKAAKPTDAYAAEMKAFEATVVGAEPPPQPGLWAFVLTAAAWGLISLVTPCVFPMIPITVSIFLKQSNQSFRERTKLAGVYCLTIITVLGLSAFALLKFMSWLSTHPVTNILMGGLFLVLALSLFGMYDIGCRTRSRSGSSRSRPRAGWSGPSSARWRSRSSALRAWPRSSAGSRASRRAATVGGV